MPEPTCSRSSITRIKASRREIEDEVILSGVPVRPERCQRDCHGLDRDAGWLASTAVPGEFSTPHNPNNKAPGRERLVRKARDTGSCAGPSALPGLLLERRLGSARSGRDATRWVGSGVPACGCRRGRRLALPRRGIRGRRHCPEGAGDRGQRAELAECQTRMKFKSPGPREFQRSARAAANAASGAR